MVRRRLLALLASMLAPVVVSLPSVALAVETLPPGVAEIVAAERAFARRCGEVGIRASFLEFFGPKAVTFRPDPGLARPRIESRPAPATPPPVLLEWGPEQAEMATAGDLGWTTGPSLFTDKSGKNPPGHGYYFSLWRKQGDGTWKVELDMGTDTPEAAIPTVATVAGPLSRRVAAAAEGGVDTLKRVDQKFCADAADGAAKAYGRALAGNGRVHRDKAAPATGKAARAWASKVKGVMSCAASGVESSDGPGFGYTFGSYERRDTKGGPVVEKGYYTRVWRWDGGWKIAADVANLVE